MTRVRALLTALDAVDRVAFTRLVRARPRRLEPAIAQIADAGRGAFLWLAPALVLRATGRPLPLARFAATTWGAYAGSVTLARAVGRRRPFEDCEVDVLIARPNGPSFPSDQVVAAFAALPLLAAAGRGGPAYAVAATALAASRVLAGVHYPGDVLAAAALGTAVGRLARQGRACE
jgi:undecaprenyl-diphosphatase